MLVTPLCLAIVAHGSTVWQETTETERAAPSAQQIMDESSRLYVGGDPDAAATLLQQGLAPWPENAQLHFMLGNLLFRKGDWSGAIDYYQAASRLRPDHPDTHLNLGYASYHAKRLEDAVKAWQDAVAQSPSDALPHLSLAIGYLAQGRDSKARRHMAQALDLDGGWKNRIVIDIRWTSEMVEEVSTLARELSLGNPTLLRKR